MPDSVSDVELLNVAETISGGEASKRDEANVISFGPHIGRMSGLQAVEHAPVPLILPVPSELAWFFKPRLEALEYHPEGSGQAIGKVEQVSDLKKNASCSNNNSLAKKKRSNRGKKRGKSKTVLQETHESQNQNPVEHTLYDLDVVSSDVSESSHEILEDSEVKKRRIEDKLWEEAFASSTSAPKSEVSVVN